MSHVSRSMECCCGFDGSDTLYHYSDVITLV